MKHDSILVTGGAGYVGSHVARRLAEHGERVLVLDDLSRGDARSVWHGRLITGDCGDQTLLGKLFDEFKVDTVFHLAGRAEVPESVSDPLSYYRASIATTRRLLEACQRAGVRRFVLASTAAVYGAPGGGVAAETTHPDPVSPYGASQLSMEWMLRDVAASGDMQYVVLRQFNVAGCHPDGHTGQPRPCPALIKVACEAAVGSRAGVYVYGTDYPTADGTAIRDYVHVDDVADAHQRALEHLRDGGASTVVNCGSGLGYSVREVLDTVQRLSGHRLDTHDSPRRAGDPPSLVADTGFIRNLLAWQPRHNLEEVIGSTLSRERNACRWPKASSELRICDLMQTRAIGR